MTSGNYFFDDGKSRKFWSYTLNGKKQTIFHGRIGTEGREATKTFPSASAAEDATTKLVNQKVGKGYVQVDPSKLKFQRDKKKWKRPATKAEVSNLERRLQAKLPDEYKEFLLTQNGGFAPEGRIGIPGDPKGRSVSVEEIYGLYDEPKGFTLLWALDNIQPRLPKGHLPIAGWLDFFSISLGRNVGCVYYWDESAAPCNKFDEVGEVIFSAAHEVLVAGSFDEFLTRLALSQDSSDTNEVATASVPATTKTEKSQPKRNDASPGKSRLSKRRQAEILRLAYQGCDELDEAIAKGEKETAKHLRKINREIDDFVTNCTDKYELDYFAEEWPRDGNIKPILKLVRNPYTDAGTLMWNYWNASVEDYYLFNKSASELEPGYDRDVFTMLRCCEQRIVNSDYRTAVIPFDPTPRISMPERYGEFARQIPPEMFKPVPAGKAKHG